MARKSRITKTFRVRVPDIPGVSDADWAEHIKTAVERWGAGGDPSDWQFNFGKASVLRVPDSKLGDSE